MTDALVQSVAKDRARARGCLPKSSQGSAAVPAGRRGLPALGSGTAASRSTAAPTAGCSSEAVACVEESERGAGSTKNVIPSGRRWGPRGPADGDRGPTCIEGERQSSPSTRQLWRNLEAGVVVQLVRRSSDCGGVNHCHTSLDAAVPANDCGDAARDQGSYAQTEPQPCASAVAAQSQQQHSSNVRPHELRKWKGAVMRRTPATGVAHPPPPAHAPRRQRRPGVTIGRDGWSVTRTGHANFDVKPASKPAKPKPPGGTDYTKWEVLRRADGEGEPNRVR